MMIEKLRVIITDIFAVIVLIVAFQNTSIVLFQFFFWDMELSLALLLFLVFVIGILSGWLLTTLWKKPAVNAPKKEIAETP